MGGYFAYFNEDLPIYKDGTSVHIKKAKRENQATLRSEKKKETTMALDKIVAVLGIWFACLMLLAIAAVAADAPAPAPVPSPVPPPAPSTQTPPPPTPAPALCSKSPWILLICHCCADWCCGLFPCPLRNSLRFPISLLCVVYLSCLSSVIVFQVLGPKKLLFLGIYFCDIAA
ncbi:hypothetical protein SLA2020_079100 [Shorea laevis]